MKSFNTASYNKRLSRVEIQQQLALLSNHSKAINTVKIKPICEPTYDQIEDSSEIKYKDMQSVKQLSVWPLRSFRNSSISHNNKTETPRVSYKDESITEAEQKYKLTLQKLKDAQQKQSDLLVKNNECYSLIQTVNAHK